MRAAGFLAVSLTAGLAALGGAPLAAQHEGHGAGEAAPSAAEQQMMEAWQKAMTPGSQHAELAGMAGEWTFDGTFWMSADQPPTQSSGSAERTLILGGRVLVEKVTSTMMEQPFEGLGMLGYDNVKGQYWSTWNDNMSTGLMVSTGTCAAGKCEFTGTYADMMTGKDVTARMVSEHQPDHEVHRMYQPGPDGKEMLAMELHYARKR